MKTLILYATKYGATVEITERIAEKLDGAVTHGLKQKPIPDLSEFDCVIIGSALYAGMIRKEAKAFLSANADALREKKIGLFLSGMEMSGDNEKTYFETNFPPELLQAAKAKTLTGGIYDPKKANFAERAIFKLAAKQSAYSDKIDDGKIARFAEEMKA